MNKENVPHNGYTRRDLIASGACYGISSAASPRSRVAVDINWEEFLSRHDLLWNRLPAKYGEAPFLGNGLMGSMLQHDATGNTLRLELFRTDVQDHRDNSYGWTAYSRPRFVLGHFLFHPAGKITGGSLRLDLWNAELRGEVRTDRGTIKLRHLIASDHMAAIAEFEPSQGESECRWTWHPGEAKTTRKSPPPPVTREEIQAFAKQYGAQYDETLKPFVPNPAVRLEREDDVQISVQDLLAGGQYAVAWRETAEAAKRILVVATANSYPARTARQEAEASVRELAGARLGEAVAAHRKWWNGYYPASFVSLPDTRLESFYWIQMYKLACATRAGRTMMDTSGPWFQPTPWPYITWDLNVQLCYWPTVTSNRLHLGMSLIETLHKNRQALIDNVRPREWQADSAMLPVTTAQDLIDPRDSDMRYFDCVGDLTWALHDCWLTYRASMDPGLLRERIFPLLRRAINLYLHLLREDANGVLHLPATYSPEYGSAPDCNYDLALLRWGCQALIESCGRLRLEDPLLPRWKDVLARLTPFPANEKEGLQIGAGVRYAMSHRHFSHLLAIYPLYLINISQPGAAALIERSVRHWMGDPTALRGFSYTGAASLMAAMGRGGESLTYLKGLDRFLQPNTMYMEAGPCLETPLSAAQSIHDMLLQSWGGVIRVFPAVPPEWKDAVFHNLRAEGGFLVSARLQGGRIAWVRVLSLSGEPCRLTIDGNTSDLKLREGEEKVLTPIRMNVRRSVTPLPADPARVNSWGLR